MRDQVDEWPKAHVAQNVTEIGFFMVVELLILPRNDTGVHYLKETRLQHDRQITILLKQFTKGYTDSGAKQDDI